MQRLIFITILTALLGACTAPGYRLSELDRLDPYRAVLIEPVQVSFADEWRPYNPNTRLPYNDAEMAAIRDRVAESFDSRFRAAMIGNGIRVVDEAGDGVLRIKPELRNVILHAPSPDIVIGKVFTRSVGRMELRAEFNDPASGDSLIILTDEQRGRDYGIFRRASNQANRQQLYQMFELWAEIIAEDMLGPGYAAN